MSGRFSLLVAGVVGIASFAPIRLHAEPQQPSTEPAPVELRTALNKYCITCHNPKLKTGGLVLDTAYLDNVSGHAAVWEKVIQKLKIGVMPPQGMPKPAETDSRGLVTFLQTALDTAAATHPNPGRPLVHRLNRSEYANAIRDLLGLDVNVSELLPPDDAAYGFDNVAEGLPLGTVGGLAVRHTFPIDGYYDFQIRRYRTNLSTIRGTEQPHEVELTLDGKRVLLAKIGGFRRGREVIWVQGPRLS